jgi:hypothetical protein
VAQSSGKGFDGKRVEFRIGNLPAAEASTWQQGSITELSLTASGTLGKLSGDGALRQRQAPGVLASPLSQGGPPTVPHVFAGTATVNGAGAPEGTIISAWIDGELVPGAEAVLTRASTGPDGRVAEDLAPIIDILTSLWKFEPATQTWKFFDPRPGLASYNTITEMTRGVYRMDVRIDGREARSVTLNGRSQLLFAGINFIDW